MATHHLTILPPTKADTVAKRIADHAINELERANLSAAEGVLALVKAITALNNLRRAATRAGR